METADHAAWPEAKEEIFRLLRERAKHRRSISNGDLTDAIQALSLHERSPVLMQLRDEICREEIAAGRGMIAVFAARTSEGGRRFPGDRFFTPEAQLHPNLNLETQEDRSRFWRSERQRVHGTRATSAVR